MKQNPSLDRAIRRSFSDQAVNPQIHRALLSACRTLPRREDFREGSSFSLPRILTPPGEPEAVLARKEPRGSGWKRALGTAFVCALIAVGLGGAFLLNFGSPSPQGGPASQPISPPALTSSQPVSQAPSSAAGNESSQPVSSANGDPVSQPISSAPSQASPGETTFTLYLSLGGESITTFPCTGEATPANILREIESRTGWNLALADEITTGKGGISVIFSSDCCLFTGPPDLQKEEFRVYGSDQLAFAVLDSVQKSLQHWANPVNPDTVDIYFAMEGDLPLNLPGLGVTLPLEQPYSHEVLEQLLSGQTMP